MEIQQFDESRFLGQVDRALKSVKTVLDNTRNPQYAADVPHVYDDKYMLVDALTNVALTAQMNVLDILGLTSNTLTQVLKWRLDRAVTIRFKSEEKCAFVKEVTREVESPTLVTQTTGLIGTQTTKSKVVTKITEYFWKFDVAYELIIFPGNNPEDKIVLRKREGTHELMTSVKDTPKPSVSVIPPIDINISWLLNNVNDNKQTKFKVDRSAKTCHTPRRNTDIESTLTYFSKFNKWCNELNQYFTGHLFPIATGHGLDLNKINDNDVFVPVLPLFEDTEEIKPSESKKSSYVPFSCNNNAQSPRELRFHLTHSPYRSDASTGLISIPKIKFGDRVLQLEDLNAFLNEQMNSIQAKLKDLEKMFPTNNTLITLGDATIIMSLLHARKIGQHYSDGVNYVEHMLRTQLISAIGKEVSPVDFSNYMVFHNRRLFKEKYQPLPFSYAVRQPDHFPEGVVGIDAHLADGSIGEPIMTICKSTVATRPMRFSINAATEIEFYGDRHIHSYVSHQFSGFSGSRLNLVARARQFSSFILVVGKIVSAEKFDPKCAIIIKDKDELSIPLDMNTIPTPKEFRDAIESLSPEQQRFAKAIRSMQLASTLFGIVIIQIKPQLEKLLRIPHDSLSKEIKLTQDLMDLFITYQIPSDLISFGGDVNAQKSEKLNKVKTHVQAMQAMIANERQKELNESRLEASMSTLESYGGGGPGRAIPMVHAALSRASNVEMPTNTGSLASGTVNVSQPGNNKSDKKLSISRSADDYTQLPVEMDRKFEALDVDGALRPTIVDIGKTWKKKSQKALLAQPEEFYLNINEQAQERNKAFDLLDALSRSGCLSFDHASLHVVLASTHCFDKTLMNTVIQDNINPVEKVERSTLIVATTIHDQPASELVAPEQLKRVATYSPLLFGEELPQIMG